jgi:hypothetical protein
MRALGRPRLLYPPHRNRTGICAALRDGRLTRFLSVETRSRDQWNGDLCAMTLAVPRTGNSSNGDRAGENQGG